MKMKLRSVMVLTGITGLFIAVVSPTQARQTQSNVAAHGPARPASPREILVRDTKSNCAMWASNLREGQGVEWSGSCKDGYAEGHGIQRWNWYIVPDDIIVGTQKAGRFEGKVEVFFRNNERFEGMLKNGLPEGDGIIVYANGWREEVYWERGRPSAKQVPKDTKNYASASSVQKEIEPGAVSPNASDKACSKYGFRMGTTAFAQCRIQIDQAKQQAQLEQQQYQLQLAQYQQQMAAYQAQQDAIKKEKDRRKWEMLGRLGAGMANSTSPSFLGALNEGLAAANGVPIAQPVAPSFPRPRTHTMVLPNGSVITCTTTGSVTNCF